MINSISSHGSKRLDHYYRCPKRLRNRDACPQPRNWRADKTEPGVWELVSGLLTDPEQLRADLERMVELERDRLRAGAPHHETKVWLEKLSEVDRERRGYHRLTAKGHMTQQELVEALAELGETRETAEPDSATLRRRHQERVEKRWDETKRPSCNPTLAWLRRP